MENNIMQFNHDQFGPLRILNQEGQPWFVAMDLCRSLDLRTDSLRSILDDDEVSTINPNSIGVAHGGRDLLIISEPGLYSLILRSRKPEAKAFRRWVTHEVLPQIRENGHYLGNLTLRQRAEMFLAQTIEMERLERLQQEQTSRIQDVEVIASAALAKAESNFGRYTVLGWARLKGMSLGIKDASSHGRNLTDICNNLGIPIESVRDPRFGSVHTYPEEILEEYFSAGKEYHCHSHMEVAING